MRALKSGAQAYPLKNALHKELTAAIKGCMRGGRYCLRKRLTRLRSTRPDDALIPAENAVLRLTAARNANKQVADQLSVTEETVKGQVKNMVSKLGANDRTQAAMIGLKRGIIEL